MEVPREPTSAGTEVAAKRLADAAVNLAEQFVKAVKISEGAAEGCSEAPAGIPAETADEFGTAAAGEAAAGAASVCKRSMSDSAGHTRQQQQQPEHLRARKKVAREGYQLHDFHSLPEFLQHNEFILRYYRVNLSLKQTLLSIFRVHNETGNIWTHLLGFFFFIILTVYTASRIPAFIELPFPLAANVTSSSEHFRDAPPSSPSNSHVSEHLLHILHATHEAYKSLPQMPHLPDLHLHLPHLPDLHLHLPHLRLPHLHVPEGVHAAQEAAGAYLSGLGEGLQSGLQDAAKGLHGAADLFRESFRGSLARLDLLQQLLQQQQVEPLQQLQQMVKALEQQVQSGLRAVELPQWKTVMSLLRYYSCVIEAALLPMASLHGMGGAAADGVAKAQAVREREKGGVQSDTCPASPSKILFHNGSWEQDEGLRHADSFSRSCTTNTNHSNTLFPLLDLSSPCPAPLLYGNPVPRWPFFLFLAGAMVCLLCSTACHLFACQSHDVFRLIHSLDYAGIAALIATSFFPPVYYGFYCQPIIRSIYLGAILVMGVCTVVVSLHPAFHGAKSRTLRTSLFFGMGVSGVIPCSHKLLYYFQEPVAITTTLLELLMGALYGVGALFYATRIPERWMPGKFDIAGHSHQIFHVLVIAAAYTHYCTGLLYLQWRDVHGCM